MSLRTITKLSAFVLVLGLTTAAFGHLVGNLKHNVQSDYQQQTAQLNKY